MLQWMLETHFNSALQLNNYFYTIIILGTDVFREEKIVNILEINFALAMRLENFYGKSLLVQVCVLCVCVCWFVSVQV